MLAIEGAPVDHATRIYHLSPMLIRICHFSWEVCCGYTRPRSWSLSVIRLQLWTGILARKKTFQRATKIKWNKIELYISIYTYTFFRRCLWCNVSLSNLIDALFTSFVLGGSSIDSTSFHKELKRGTNSPINTFPQIMTLSSLNPRSRSVYLCILILFLSYILLSLSLLLALSLSIYQSSFLFSWFDLHEFNHTRQH